ncbi:hypothetical protein BC829DRAFT_422049 [Chytridium lagenaria]|nr:hypothetical protein BC829DRAFT_422049 [Chytridium lagenaria]
MPFFIAEYGQPPQTQTSPAQSQTFFLKMFNAPIYDCRETLNFAHIQEHEQFTDELGVGSVIVIVFEFRTHRSSLGPYMVSLDTKFVAVLHATSAQNDIPQDLPDVTI